MKKIGEIKGIPVVEGNINEVTKNQIHYEETDNGIQLSKRGSDNKLNSVTSGSDNSSDNNDSSNEYFQCFEYIRIDGADLVHLITPELLNVLGMSKYILPYILCAYGSDEPGWGDWKVLVDLPVYEAFVQYEGPEFVTRPTTNEPIYGYRFFNHMAVKSKSSGMIGNPFIDVTGLKEGVDKNIIDILGDALAALLVFVGILDNPEIANDINGYLKNMISRMEIKKITIEEYYTIQYQKAKEYYDSLEPIE